MNPITIKDFTIYFENQGFNAINKWIKENKPSTIFVLVDDKTMENCYPYLMPMIETTATIEVIEIDHGEEYKNIDTCAGVWSALVELGCDRNSLMINLGGGVITDLGGFIASTIKRGIPFIHIPTTLLGMVDAAIGGKNGVDLGHLKNQIGVINPPIMTIIDPAFLRTLPQQHLVNGSIEMFKHGLISDRVYWKDMLHVTDYLSDTFNSLIYQSAVIKSDIVSMDPFEKGPRKALNYGHTAGHAIESFLMEHPEREAVLHGEAIAAGIVIESYLSVHYAGLSTKAYEEIKEWYTTLDFKFSFNDDEVMQMIQLMKYDKKNTNGEIKFVLLDTIGSFITNQVVSNEDIIKAFQELKI
ncbi:3-dehydroquinate synthase [Nonlabens mediterrranea]|uniref:3-dehydroquinate synthase n=1 Tax=Nonlabens mediterrranea TaxID=1419947 RepID=A0ABS0A3X3_9FLAO|nr:3-dehydroquinate synthase [Nonlabens mediterrranea]